MVLSFETGLNVLTDYFQSKGFITKDESVLKLEKPGEGNMNWVARVCTQKRSIIVKQANPFVQKYPQIAAPQERILVEATFYGTIQNYPGLQNAMPKLLGLDVEGHVLALEDMGSATDFTFLYAKRKGLSQTELEMLVRFINELHAIPVESLRTFPENKALRTLNHEHLFVYPFLKENGFNLDQIQNGLQEVAMKYKTDEELTRKVGSIGDIYLSIGNTLLHGDYYPGSWLKTGEGLKIIDPEFSFVGFREFDLGIFIAHMKMTESNSTQLDWIIKNYHTGGQFNWDLCFQFVGIEMMRRIIGLAQLPFDLTLNEKEKLLTEAYHYIIKE